MNKYRAVRTEVDGIRFDSKKEARRYKELMLLYNANAIEDLVLQPKFRCEINGKLICNYSADFSYRDKGGIVVEDVKSPITAKQPVYRIKKKLVEALHGVVIVEVI